MYSIFYAIALQSGWHAPCALQHAEVAAAAATAMRGEAEDNSTKVCSLGPLCVDRQLTHGSERLRLDERMGVDVFFLAAFVGKALVFVARPVLIVVLSGAGREGR